MDVLTADHITITDKPLVGETTNKRLWAIFKQYPTNEGEFYAAKNLALLWYYHNNLKCEYSASAQKKINAIGA